MKVSLNDPKWTAYAFDELEPAERAAIEADLQDNAAARQFVDELKATSELLKSALAKEPAARLTTAQRATLAEAVGDKQPALVAASAIGSPPLRNGRRRRWIAALGAVAASGLIAALLLPASQAIRESARRVEKKKTTSTTTTESRPMNDDHLADYSGIRRAAPTAPTDGLHFGDQASDSDAAVPLQTSSVRNDLYESGQRQGRSKIRLIPPTSDSRNGYASNSPEATPDNKSIAYTIQEPVYENKSESESVPATQPQSAAIPIGPAQIEYLEGLNQIVIRGNPRDAERVQKEIDRLEVGVEGKVDTKPAAAVDTTSAESQKRLTQLKEELARHSLNATAPGPGESAEVARLRSEIHALEEIDASRSAEAYDLPPENAFEPVAANPLSTFSIDVDTASYANVRRFLMQNNQLPPPAAVRIEEMLNYFRYQYPQPEGDVPFSVTTEVATCPWNSDHRLVRVGLKGREVAKEQRPVSNLVFLLDVSGSMQPANKLPLVREAMKMLVRELSENDRVAIVVYAGASGMVLDSTTGDQKDQIVAAIDRLQAGGSTNGAGGLQQAYDVALQHFVKAGTNRVILATDGDFNVGITDRDQLIKLIEDKAKSGVFLTTLGFGMGNLKDATLEQLADKGNGNYAYVDTLAEARKVFVEELAGTLITIAKDVKVQIEFNPAEVASYRLIGYENRQLAAEDFNNDKKDAGEIGAGHTVTALYELAPVEKNSDKANPGLSAGAGQSGVDPLRYQKPAASKVDLTDAAKNGELFTLKLRYKQPDGDTSKLIQQPVKDSGKAYREASGDFKFAAAVAAFGMKLRHSQHGGTITLDGIKELAQEGRSYDPSGYRSEFMTLVEKAQALGAK